jgi:hypothetical protein
VSRATDMASALRRAVSSPHVSNCTLQGEPSSLNNRWRKASALSTKCRRRGSTSAGRFLRLRQTGEAGRRRADRPGSLAQPAVARKVRRFASEGRVAARLAGRDGSAGRSVDGHREHV